MSKNKQIGIYPGTFDPITKGHLHIIKRASRLVDKLVIGVAGNERKNPLFTHEQRIAMVEQDVANMKEISCEVEVQGFDSLLVHYAAEQGASCLFRGLRAVSDFDYEFQMTGMNIRLAPGIETVFLMASDKWQFVSASFVKEVYTLGGDVSEFVTPNVIENLQNQLEGK